MAKKIKVVLLENLAGYGNRGTIIEVAPPYAKNVLFPKKIAKLADDFTINSIKQQQDKKDKIQEKEIEDIKGFLAKVNKGIEIEKKITEKGTLYDKVDAKDILNHIMTNYQLKLPKDAIVIDNKIENEGEYEAILTYLNMNEKLKIIIKGV